MPRTFYNLEFPELRFPTCGSSQSTTNITYPSQPVLDPFNSSMFSENTAITHQPLPELSPGSLLGDIWDPLSLAGESSASFQAGNSSNAFVLEEWAARQQTNPGSFHLFSPLIQIAPEMETVTSDTDHMLPLAEPTLSPDNTPGTSHADLPSSRASPNLLRPRWKPCQAAFSDAEAPTPSSTGGSGDNQPERCPLCPKTATAARTIERHLWTRHPQFALLSGVRSELRNCPFHGCRYRGRKDNTSRHYRVKHGGSIKWKKGMAVLN